MFTVSAYVGSVLAYLTGLVSASIVFLDRLESRWKGRIFRIA